MNARAVVANSAAVFAEFRAGRRWPAAWATAFSVALVVLQLVAGPAHAQSVKEFSAGITQAPQPRAIALGPDGNIWFTEFGGNRVGKITPGGVVTEYSAGISAGAGPGGIIAGPDGNMWFTERLTSKIARITMAGTVTEFGGLSAGSVPISITAGPDGNLWFTENPGNRIGRITTSGVVTEFSAGITPGAGPVSIVAGPDGNLWFTEGNVSKIGQITTGGVVTEFGAGISAGANSQGIAVGPDNNLWFAELNTDKIAYITTAGVVTEFGGLTAGAGPNSVTAGPDGNMWFAELNGNRIGKITLVGVVTEYSAGISAGAMPRNIVTGNDGNLWFTEFGLPQIGMITPLGAITEFSAGITPGAAPFYITSGPDGNLWFTEPSIDAIGRITPLGVVTEFRTGITTGAAPVAITTGPDGNLWFTEYDGNRIGRITPTGVVTEFSAGITAASSPAGITVGPDNNLWFTEDTGGRIGRITIAGVITEFSAGITGGAGPGDIRTGPDGNLWFTESAIDRIGRITPAGVVTEFSAGITAGSSPQGITLGPDNNMWFTETNAARVGKIIALPANGTVGTVTEFVGISGATEFIAAGPDGNLWFTENTTNRIGRITPAGVFTQFPGGITANAGLEGIVAGPDGNLWFAENGINRVARVTTTSDFVVINNNDSGAGSLRDAVAQANVAAGSPTIAFAPTVTGTILLTSGQIAINRGMTITGPGATTLTIDANAFSRVFSIFQTDPACPALDGPDYLVSISGLRLTNAHRTTSNGAGAIFTEHSLALDSMTIENNIAGSGGGLFFYVQYPGQTLTITNSQFLNNKAQPIGPSATSDSGGALFVGEKCAVHTSPVTVGITGSVFSGNQSLPATLNGSGGAIFIDTVADVTITDTRIVNNAIMLPNPPPSTQSYRGGGVQAHAKTLNIVRSEISGNSIVDVSAADLSRGGGMVLFNTASDLQGPGDVMTAKIINSTISGNTSPATAGALMVSGNAFLEIDNSTVADNAAAAGRTGGILMTSGPTNPPTASNTTPPTLTLVSTILATNSDSDLSENLATMPSFTVNATNSAIQNICPLPSCNITVSGSGNLLATDPMLGPLANHGGPTQTQALLAGSPAIDVGSNPLALTTDQRGAGFPRVIHGVADMGAYEFSTAVPPVLQSAVSRRTHGAAGTFDLPLSLTAVGVVNHAPTTDPRQGPNQTIVFTFDKPLNAATATINEGVATAGTPTFAGNAVVVPLTGVNNQQYVTVTLTSVASTDGGTGGTGEVRVGFLLGDVNQSRVVSIADLGIVNSVLAQVVTASNYLKDVNVSGTLTLADKGITNANLTKALGAP